MRLLGTIVRLQYQRDHLKVPGARFKQYDPINIVSVDELRFTPEGVEAGPADAPLIDVHNVKHPRSRNRGDNGVSIGFTGHYAAMRERLGDRLVDGIAGENILVAFDGIVEESELAAGIAIETCDGLAKIDEIIVAAPCVEFSRYAIAYPPDERPNRQVTETVQFLDNGMRGFYASVRDPFTVRIGDPVFLRAEGE